MRRASRECEANAGNECATLEAAAAAVVLDDLERFGCVGAADFSDCGVMVESLYALLTGFCGVAATSADGICCCKPSVAVVGVEFVASAPRASTSRGDSEGVPGAGEAIRDDLPLGEEGAEEPLAFGLFRAICRRFVGFVPFTCHCEVIDLLSELPGRGKSMVSVE